MNERTEKYDTVFTDLGDKWLVMVRSHPLCHSITVEIIKV